jgi:hypothetical protein
VSEEVPELDACLESPA